MHHSCTICKLNDLNQRELVKWAQFKILFYNQAKGVVTIFTQIDMGSCRNLNHKMRYQLSWLQFTWFNPISLCQCQESTLKLNTSLSFLHLVVIH